MKSVFEINSAELDLTLNQNHGGHSQDPNAVAEAGALLNRIMCARVALRDACAGSRILVGLAEQVAGDADYANDRQP